MKMIVMMTYNVEPDFNFDHNDNDVDQFLNSPITEKEIKNVVLK
jgi:hypothetical protein